MTTPAVPAKKITDTIRGTCNALTFIQENIVIQDGALTTEQLRFVRNAIGDILITLWNGPISSKDSWAVAITMKPSEEHGKAESSPEQNEKT